MLAGLRSLPRAAAGLVGAAVLTGTVAYFLPRVFSAASGSGPPVKTDVLYSGLTRLAMVVSPAALRTPGQEEECDATHEWGLAAGGADAGESVMKVVLQGNTSGAVYVAGIRPRVLSESAPTRGVLVLCPTAGTAVEKQVYFNLDSHGAQRFVTSGRGAPFGPGFTLPRGETEVFDVSATTRRHTIKWLLEVELVVDGTTHRITVTEKGKPFVTTAYSPRLPRYTFEAGAWRVSDLTLADFPPPQE